MSRKIIELDTFRNGFSGRGNRARAPQTPEPARPAARTDRDLSVLVASRDADNAAAVCHALAEMNLYDANVATVKSIAEAHATLNRDAYDLLILDDRLLSGNALALIRDLAGRKPSCASILIVSAKSAAARKSGKRRTARPSERLQASAGLLRFLPRQGLDGNGLEKAVGEALESARSRDRKAASRDLAQLRKSGMHKPAARTSGARKPGTRSIDHVLPWVRGLLGELNKIHGGASLALEGLDNDDKENPRALLRSAVQVSDHLRAEILDTIRQLEASQQPEEKEPVNVDITELLEQVVRDYRTDAEARGQTLSYRRPDLPLTLAANAGSVRDVFCVILRNTIRNTSENTRIDIALSIRDGEICISVCDTCPDGHWTKALCPEQANSSATGSVMREKAGSIILINELMRECNGSIDITTQNHSNEMRCFFPRRGVA